MTITSPATESAVGSTVLNHSADAVWAVIRDFNSYPTYIDGVTESHLEDAMRGDEVGCVRRFVYNGNTIRQTLTGHCDAELWFTHAGCDPLEWPIDGENVSPVDYTNRVQVRRMTDANRALVEWSLTFKCAIASDLERWKRYFENSIPVWLASLKSHLDARAGVCRKGGDVKVIAAIEDPAVIKRMLGSSRQPTIRRAAP